MSEIKKKLTITVLDKKSYPDIIAKYCHEVSSFSPVCDQFEVGQVFYTDCPENCPEGFCAWAWKNINQEVKAAYAGRTLPWVKVPHTYIACCSDGFRPVFFEILYTEEEG